VRTKQVTATSHKTLRQTRLFQTIIYITLHLHTDIATLAAMPTERELQISPIVPESVVHNTKVRPFSLASPPGLPICPISPLHVPPRRKPAFNAPFTPFASLLNPVTSPYHQTFGFSQPQRLPAPHPLFFAHQANTFCVSSQTLTTLRNLTASLFGVGAGILGLESYPGFLFYIAFSLLTSALVYALRVRGVGVKTYFRGSMELWTGGLLEGLSGFVLTWTLFYGLVRA
jgi:hypothetical protein